MTTSPRQKPSKCKKSKQRLMSWHPDICLNKISTSKDTEAPAKTTSLRQDIACCARICYLGVGQWRSDFWVNFRKPSSNGSMLDPIKCWIVSPSFCLRSNICKEKHIWLIVKNKQTTSKLEKSPCHENCYLTVTEFLGNIKKNNEIDVKVRNQTWIWIYSHGCWWHIVA